MSTQVIRHPDPDSLAAAIAARLVTCILDSQARTGKAHIVLTGGGVGTASLAAVRNEPAARAVNWGQVHFWWSDERFEPEGSELRNETGARSALLDHLPISAEQVHPMPAKGGVFGDNVEAAAAGYAAELAEHGSQGDELPDFAVAMLGVGPDGHVASLFPGHEGVTAPGLVIPVHNSPKPPPTRISFTLAAINSARAVWLVADGQAKAEALGHALGVGRNTQELPAGQVHGTEETLALLDTAAASGLAN